MSRTQAAALVAAANPGPLSDSTWREAACSADGRPHPSKQQIVCVVSLLDPARATHMGPIYVLAQRAVASMFGQYNVVVAIWPDQVAAVVPLDPSHCRSRGEQLVRAYHAAHAGVLLYIEPNDTEHEDLPC